MKKYCSICKKELGRHAQYQEGKYCKQCYLKNIAKIIVKGKFHPNFKTGKPKCIDCNKELNNYNAKRC
jgi:calcineurin-like phosphoesterase family protein